MFIHFQNEKNRFHAKANSPFFDIETFSLEALPNGVQVDKTRIIMIVDSKAMAGNKNVLTNKSIVGVILFGGHDKYVYVIDYLAINYDKRYNSFGPLLINFSQLISSKILQRNTDARKSLKKKTIYNTFLGCREEVVDFYRALGFSIIKNLSILDKIRHLIYVGDRIDYCNW